MVQRVAGDIIRVLVVDDEPIIRDVLRQMLENFSYTVDVAADGEEALARYAAFHPHIILLDLNMPRLGGADVVRHIRDEKGDDEVNIIMLTSMQTPESKMEAFGAGADDFLYKPFDRAEILARVAVGARQVRLTRRLRRARDDMGREISLVASLQQKLLPYGGDDGVCGALSEVPGVHVHSVYRPSGACKR